MYGRALRRPSVYLWRLRYRWLASPAAGVWRFRCRRLALSATSVWRLALSAPLVCLAYVTFLPYMRVILKVFVSLWLASLPACDCPILTQHTCTYILDRLGTSYSRLEA